MDFGIAAAFATAAIALYAAGLSTWLAVQQWRDRQTRISVSVEFGKAVDMPGDPTRVQLFTVWFDDTDPKERLLILSATNTGQREATLGSLSFLLFNDETLFLKEPMMGDDFPYDLAPGKSCCHYMSAYEFARRLLVDKISGTVRLTACYTDQLGKRHLSKPFDYDVDAWVALRPVKH